LTSPLSEAPRLPSVRRALREARRNLSTRDQRLHARALKRLLGKDPAFLRARRLAAYWPADGELDPRPLLALARRRGRRIFLPVLRRPSQGRLWFLPYQPCEPLSPNRFGIPEPRRRRQHIRLAWHLDLLLVPLVGFDRDCNRLGMGGGFYDRTLAFLSHRSHWRRPRLIGIAHECQHLQRIESRPWDIPLDGVATERRIYWKRGPRAEGRGPAT
jgi:5-formyltetrahydrofolate cyclo-ligase